MCFAYICPPPPKKSEFSKFHTRRYHAWRVQNLKEICFFGNETDTTFLEFPCPYCPRFFETQSSLNYHIRDTHIEKEQRSKFSHLDHNKKIDFPIYICSNQNCTFPCKTSKTLEKHESQHWQFEITPKPVEKAYSHTIGVVPRDQLKNAKNKWMKDFLIENVEEEESTE